MSQIRAHSHTSRLSPDRAIFAQVRRLSLCSPSARLARRLPHTPSANLPIDRKSTSHTDGSHTRLAQPKAQPTVPIQRLRVYSAGTRAAVPYPPSGIRLTRTSEPSPARPQSIDTPLQPTKYRVRQQLHHPAAAALAPATRLALPPYPVLSVHHKSYGRLLGITTRLPRLPPRHQTAYRYPHPTDQVQSTDTASSPGGWSFRSGHQTGTASLPCSLCTPQVLWTASRHHHPASKASAKAPDSLPIPPSNRPSPAYGNSFITRSARLPPGHQTAYRYPHPTDQVQSTATASSPGAKASRPGHQTGTASFHVLPQYTTSLMDGSPVSPSSRQGSRPATRQLTDTPHPTDTWTRDNRAMLGATGVQTGRAPNPRLKDFEKFQSSPPLSERGRFPI
jgi:hypothetical protein